MKNLATGLTQKNLNDLSVCHIFILGIDIVYIIPDTIANGWDGKIKLDES